MTDHNAERGGASIDLAAVSLELGHAPVTQDCGPTFGEVGGALSSIVHGRSGFTPRSSLAGWNYRRSGAGFFVAKSADAFIPSATASLARTRSSGCAAAASEECMRVENTPFARVEQPATKSSLENRSE
jgi:hypothetical protein